MTPEPSSIGDAEVREGGDAVTFELDAHEVLLACEFDRRTAAQRLRVYVTDHGRQRGAIAERSGDLPRRAADFRRGDLVGLRLVAVGDHGELQSVEHELAMAGAIGAEVLLAHQA